MAIDVHEEIRQLCAEIDAMIADGREQEAQLQVLGTELIEAKADRDRARDAAVALEQQLAEIKKLAYVGGQNGEIIRAAILGVFEGDLHEEDL
jgi:predicted  nucleic acid-binding Zn-ribbon protein